MSRINRKNWTSEDIAEVSQGGMLDLFDNLFKGVYRINDDEFDNIGGNANQNEIQVLCQENPTFAEKRQIISILNKYVNYV